MRLPPPFPFNCIQAPELLVGTTHTRAGLPFSVSPSSRPKAIRCVFLIQTDTMITMINGHRSGWIVLPFCSL